MFLQVTKRFLILSFLLIAIEEGIFARKNARQRNARADETKAWNPATPCDPNPCQNKGHCIAKRRNYYCDCGTDYAGTNCETSIGNKEAFKDETVAESNLEYKVTEAMLPEKRTFMTIGVINHDAATIASEGRFGAEGLEKTRLGYTGKSRITMGGTYLGCAADEANAAGEILGSHMAVKLMTVEMCLTLCRYKRFTYAAVSNGHNCLCRNYYNPAAVIEERLCTQACGGNRSQVCGGKDVASIWTSCPMGFFGGTCRHRCRCALYQCNIDDGICPTSACKIGWKGNSCEELDIVGFRSQTGCWIMIGGYAVMALFMTFTGTFFIAAFKMGNVEWTKGNFKTMIKIIKGQKIEQPVVYKKRKSGDDDDSDDGKDKKKEKEKK